MYCLQRLLLHRQFPLFSWESAAYTGAAAIEAHKIIEAAMAKVLLNFFFLMFRPPLSPEYGPCQRLFCKLIYQIIIDVAGRDVVQTLTVLMTAPLASRVQIELIISDLGVKRYSERCGKKAEPACNNRKHGCLVGDARLRFPFCISADTYLSGSRLVIRIA